MATKIVMEALSPTMEEGRLVKWLKKEGDVAAKGDVLAEIETDKAVMELVARGDGVLRARVLAEGDTAPVGALVGVIGGKDEDISAIVAAAGKPAAAAAAAGGTSPAAASAPAPATTVAAPSAPAVPAAGAPGAKVPAGAAAADSSAPAAAAVPPGNGQRRRASPLARRLAREQGLDLAAVSGSGPGGRIVRRDIESALAQGGISSAAAAPTGASAAAAAPAGAPAAAPTVVAPPPRAIAPRSGAEFTDVPLTQIRKTIARRLAESIGPVPTFYLTMEADLTRLAEMREAMAALGDGYKVSYNDIVMKVAATALAQHPEVNAHWLGDRMRQFSRVHLGMAVAVEDGLITPVIRDADAKGLRQIAAEARELAQRARARRLTPEEYTGATFSISNLGMFGIDEFTAIINPPEAGIIAVGAVGEKPVAANGAIVARPSMRFTMSCDHRVIDGATGARFLQTFRRMLENPLMMTF